MNTFSFLTGSTVDYAGASTQIVEESFSYHNITISGGGQKNLEGNTSANGTLDLVNGIMLCSTFNMTVNPARPLAALPLPPGLITPARFSDGEATPVNYPSETAPQSCNIDRMPAPAISSPSGLRTMFC
ncbi:MAG: hypothetical protein IPM81_18820 [Saprospirales bacterium]|nr:hypothetical protein [Saprospirales bacterium]